MLRLYSSWIVCLATASIALFMSPNFKLQEKPVDCSFFQPDDFVFESTSFPLALGLSCIEAIEGRAEEIFLVTALSEPAVFVDIGYGSQYTENSASAVFDLADLLDYLSRNHLDKKLYFVHNHPQFENIPIAPPSFADLVVLSNLHQSLAEQEIDIELTGLVINSGGGLWHFNTTPELEANTMIPLRSTEVDRSPNTRWTPAMKIYMKHTFGWAKIWKDYPDDPHQMAQEMGKKGVEVIYFESVDAFMEALE